MPGQEEPDSVSLRDHVLALMAEKDLRDQQRFEAQNQAIAAAMSAAEKAVVKSEAAADRRFESVNEFRSQLADLVARLLPRIEYDTAHQALIDKITDLASRVDKTEGNRSGGRELWGYLVAAAAVIVAVVALITR